MTATTKAIAAHVLAILVCLGAAAENASATVTTLGLWRGGENDPGASAGNIVNATTLDFTANNFDASRNGSPTYSASTPPAIGLTELSYDFAGGADDFSRSVVTTATDNWGLETWVYFDGAQQSDTTVLYNGSTGGSGFGLVLLDAGGGLTWHTLIGGVNFGDTGVPVATDTWQHVAAVRDNGTLSLYVDGVQTGLTFNNNPNAPGGNLQFGNIIGQLDEVRVFNFTGGAFNPANDLLLNNAAFNKLGIFAVPEPSTGLLLMAGTAVLALRRNRRCRFARC